MQALCLRKSLRSRASWIFFARTPATTLRLGVGAEVSRESDSKKLKSSDRKVDHDRADTTPYRPEHRALAEWLIEKALEAWTQKD